MGGAGFGQGLTQGLQQAQDRQMQMQHLKLQQDFAKYQQKTMETQDQLHQLQLQSLQKKIEAETRLPSMQENLTGPQAAPLGPNDQGPMPQAEPEIDRQKLVSLLQVAQQAGQDPEQLLHLMGMADPRIEAIRQSLQPEKVIEVKQGEQVVGVKPGQPPRSIFTNPAKPEKPVSVAPGGSLVNPETGQVTFTAPAAPAKPPDFGDRLESLAAAYSQNKYGKAMTFSEMLAYDPIQAQKLRDVAMVDEPATITAGKLAASIPVKEKELLTPTEANELGVPFGTTKGEAKGTMSINAHQREALAAFDSARAIIADIEQYAKRVNVAPGGLRGKAEQGAKLWGAWTQSDPDAALLQSKAGELSNLARAMGEKGSLAKDDIARAAALVPSVLDSKPVAIQKILDMNALINKGEASFRATLGLNARQPVITKPSAPMKAQPADPLASIPVPKGLTPQQEQVYRQAYAEERQRKAQQMKPKATK